MAKDITPEVATAALALEPLIVQYLTVLFVASFINSIAHLLAAIAAALVFSAAAQAQDRVVYHIDNAEMQATKGLRNIRNHLDVAPDTKIVVVTHADGVDFMMEGAKDKKNPNIDYASLVSALKAPE